MSESAKEVFARIPEARRDAAVREADERCHGLYARAWQENCGDVFEKGRAAVAAEDAARAAVFARFAEPAAPMQPVTGDCYHSSQNWRRESDGIHCDECEAEPAAPLASSRDIFMRIPEQCRAAARKEANTMGNDAWQARYDNTRGDLAAAAQAEEAARAKVFSRYAAPVEVGPTITDVKAALNRIPKERRIDAMHLADTETADVYRDAFRAADGDMAAKVRAGSAAERAARIAVFEKYAAQSVGESVIDAIEARVNSHTGMAARMDCAWLIGEVKRLRTELATTNAELGRWKRERCMSPAIGPWSADGARIIGRGNRIVAHTSSQSSPNPDAVQDAHAIAEMLNHAEAQAPLDAFDATWERVRIAAERAHQALSQFGETQAPEATELRAALDAINCKPVPEQQNISVSKLRGSFSRARLDEVSLVAAEAKAAERDAACPVHPLHGAKPSDACPRVVFVEPFGYDRDDHLNPTFSGQISGAKRFSDTEAQKRASQLRVAGYQKVRVIRLRPRAK